MVALLAGPQPLNGVQKTSPEGLGCGPIVLQKVKGHALRCFGAHARQSRESLG
jgi:hypothetical protein